jgi:DNA-binding transcriptional MerR regulator
MSERKYLTPAEVAERYQGKVTVRTLANWRSTGISPPYTKLNGRVLYPLEDLLAWEARRTVQSTSQYGRIAG